MKQKRGLLFPVALVVAFIVVLTGCKQGMPALTVKSPTAEVLSMIVGSGSVFMEIVNAGSGDDILTAANAEISGAITELHDMKDGKMIKTDRIRIPSQSSRALKPGSVHIMLFNLPKTIKAGYRFTLSLTFEKSGVIKVPVTLTSHSPAIRMDHKMHGC